MASQSVEALVEGGKATAAPPLGPALGPLGVNIGQVVAEINKRTAAFKGMKVPVTVTVETETKEFSIAVGTPPTAQLIKQEAGVEKGSGRPNTEQVADLAIEQVIKIAKMKEESMLGRDLKRCVKEVIGTCNAMGILVEGKRAGEALKLVEAGSFDEEIRAEKTELSTEELERLRKERQQMQAELAQKHAAMEAKAKELLEKAGGDAAKARKLMEEAGIDETIIDAVAPKPASSGEKKGEEKK